MLIHDHHLLLNNNQRLKNKKKVINNRNKIWTLTIIKNKIKKDY